MADELMADKATEKGGFKEQALGTGELAIAEMQEYREVGTGQDMQQGFDLKKTEARNAFSFN